MKENPLHSFHEHRNRQSETFEAKEIGFEGSEMEEEGLFTDSISEVELVSMRNKMFEAITKQKNRDSKGVQRSQLIQTYRRVAAVIGLVAVYSYLFWTMRQPDSISYQTKAGEVQQFELPDGTKITLNGNSILSYTNSQWKAFNRKVQLEGEAFFEVAKTIDQKRFHINQEHAFAVEVFGTTFNMKTRKEYNAVALMEGSVQIKVNKEGNEQEEAFFLEPGELAKFDGNTEKLTVESHKKLDRLYAWKEGKLKLQEDNLKEVLEIVGEIYGLDVVVASNKLNLDKKVTGTLPIGPDHKETVPNLAILFDKKISCKENTITIY